MANQLFELDDLEARPKGDEQSPWRRFTKIEGDQYLLEGIENAFIENALEFRSKGNPGLNPVINKPGWGNRGLS